LGARSEPWLRASPRERVERWSSSIDLPITPRWSSRRNSTRCSGASTRRSHRPPYRGTSGLQRNTEVARLRPPEIRSPTGTGGGALLGSLPHGHGGPRSNTRAIRRRRPSVGGRPRLAAQCAAAPDCRFQLQRVFESREAYQRNAAGPEWDARFRRMRELLVSDPEWHDGEVIFSRHRSEVESRT